MQLLQPGFQRVLEGDNARCSESLDHYNKETTMLELKPQCFSSDCPSRALFDQIADKWSMMVLAVLDDGPQRFNEIRRRLQGVTQKALTQCLRRLERNGLVSREVISLSPVAVQYRVTPLGRTLQQPFRALHEWTLEKLPEVDAARQAFDAAASATANPQGRLLHSIA